VYGPSEANYPSAQRSFLLSSLSQWLGQPRGAQHVVGGDFNFALDSSLDCQAALVGTPPSSLGPSVPLGHGGRSTGPQPHQPPPPPPLPPSSSPLSPCSPFSSSSSSSSSGGGGAGSNTIQPGLAGSLGTPQSRSPLKSSATVPLNTYLWTDSTDSNDSISQMLLPPSDGSQPALPSSTSHQTTHPLPSTSSLRIPGSNSSSSSSSSSEPTACGGCTAMEDVVEFCARSAPLLEDTWGIIAWWSTFPEPTR